MAAQDPQRPWTALPPETGAVLRPVLPTLADEIIAAIAEGIPAYARPMAGAFGRGVRVGVKRALGRFVDLIERGGDPDGSEAREVYVALGRGEMRAGRSLDALLGAYRLGARLAWRRFVDAGVAGGLPPDTIYLLGEAIFAYIDGISAESIEGYAVEHAATEGELQRRRGDLVRLLSQDPPIAEEDLWAAAAEARWEPPASLAALVVDTPDADRQAVRLGPGALAASLGERTLAFVPDPQAPGRHRQLEAALAGVRGALGPTVPCARAATSARRALAVDALQARGILPADRLVVAEDHLAALVLHADPDLGGELAAHELAPLAEVSSRSRARLAATLRAWIDRPGQVQAVAATLGVHPQTVRYRMNRLRELFGARLEDPEARLRLALALRVALSP